MWPVAKLYWLARAACQRQVMDAAMDTLGLVFCVNRYMYQPLALGVLRSLATKLRRVSAARIPVP